MVGQRRRNFSHFLRIRLGRVFFEGGRLSRGRSGRAISRNLIYNTIYLRERRVATRKSSIRRFPVYFIILRSSRRRCRRRSRCRLVTISFPPPGYDIFLRECSSGNHKFPVLCRPPCVLPLRLFYDSRDNASTMIGKQCHRRRTFDNSDG